MILIDTDDPFTPHADPDFSRHQPAPAAQAGTNTRYDCNEGTGLSRRAILAGVGALSMIPMTSAAEVIRIPCIQETQRITPCRHRFCRHYGGVHDYYHRR